ncbi:hypothetical protein F53441_13614 [Fusarium austroafricanum]|uniref:Uncharacterized protein n=1 Tax=Fusarium austroafricanum TaxID=2364996 RepID=A0A8H4NHA8_9HYPO|nr:hypothetical protein F53441_13614 [Fusarium austroafricanum]
MKEFKLPEHLPQLIQEVRDHENDVRTAVLARGYTPVPLKAIPATYDFQITLDRDENVPSSLWDQTNRFLVSGGCPETSHVLAVVNFEGNNDAPPYQNYVHASGSDVMCVYNYFEEDKTPTSAKLF